MSPRLRVRLAVAAVALAAAAVAIAGGLLLDGGEEAGQAPALELSIVGNDAQARALRAAERAYERGRREDARRQFEAVLSSDPSSLEAAVGVAVAAWPNGTLERLRELAEGHPGSALVRLHLGLALYAEGEREDAAAEWRAAKRREPDTPAALRAEDLLHPEMAPGRPIFIGDMRPRESIPPQLTVERQLELLRAAAERGNDAGDWLVYGAALQRLGRPLSARAAYERAVELDPDGLENQVAAAVAEFDKDAPERAFARLGPLARDHPRAGIVRFHLGLLLLWIRQVDEARRQLELAAQGKGFYAREARQLLLRLENI